MNKAETAVAAQGPAIRQTDRDQSGVSLATYDDFADLYNRRCVCMQAPVAEGKAAHEAGTASELLEVVDVSIDGWTACVGCSAASNATSNLTMTFSAGVR